MASRGRYRLVLLCTGNTCRSPMAAAVFRAELGAEAARVDVVSAGVSAQDGEAASDGARDAARRAGLDLSDHRSRRATGTLLRDADLVLVMDRGHARAAVGLGADAARVHVLSEWPEPGEPELPVSDPFGGSAEAYDESLRRIRRHVRRIVPTVRAALGAHPA